MFSNKSKSQLLEAESAYSDLDGRLASLRQEANQVHRDLQERKAVQERATEGLKQLQSAIAAGHAEKSKAQTSIEQLKREAQELQGELAARTKIWDVEREAMLAGRGARAQLDKVLQSLNDVHEELRLLSSEEAKTAALHAAGGDIPESIVPRPTPQIHAEGFDATGEDLWVVSSRPASASRNPVSTEVRDASQSIAVLAAMQRSLTAKAAELREGLRQRGFAQGATKRTDELRSQALDAKSRGDAEASTLQEKRIQLQQERAEHVASLGKLNAEHENLRKSHASLKSDAAGGSKSVDVLSEKRDRCRRSLEQAVKDRGHLQRDYDEASRLLEQRNEENTLHAAESERRRGAAERLMHRSREQANTAAADLSQAKQELASFKQAHAVLTETHQIVLSDLEAEKAAHERLKEDHDELSRDLNALARHYMDLLPEGMGGPEKYDPASPRGMTPSALALQGMLGPSGPLAGVLAPEATAA